MNNKEYIEDLIVKLKKDSSPLDLLINIENQLQDEFFNNKHDFETVDDNQFKLTPEIFSSLQELKLALTENRYDTGSYYTDSILINRILDEGQLWQKTVLDPACGTGNFPIKLILKYINKFNSKDEVVNYISSFLFLNELQSQSIDIFIVRINYIIFNHFQNKLNETDISKIKKNITVKDYLLDFSDNKKYDAIIGNPPYLGIKSLDKDYRDLLKKEFGYVEDLYVLFVEKSKRILKKNGFFAFVTSSTYLTIKTKASMRDILIKNGLYRIDGNNSAHFNIQTKTATFYCNANKKSNEATIFKENNHFNLISTNTIPLSDNNIVFPIEQINLKLQKQFQQVEHLLEKYKKHISTSSKFKKFILTDEYQQIVKNNKVLPLGLVAFIGTGVDFKGNNKDILFSINNKKYNLITDTNDIAEVVLPEEFLHGLNNKKYIKAIKGREILYVKWNKTTFNYLKQIKAPLRNLSLYGEELLYCKTSTYEFTPVDNNTLCINTAGACFIKPVIDISIQEILQQIDNGEMKDYINNSINNSLCLTPNNLKALPIHL